MSAAGYTRAAPLLLIGLGAAAHGSGMAITEMSAKGLGTAFASGGAAAEDATTQWFNPASMVLIDEAASVTASYVAPHFEYSDAGSRQHIGSVTLPLLPTGDASDQGGRAAAVPALFYVRQVSDRLHLGIGVNAPFGLATDYDDDWRGRYQALHSEIVDVNVNGNVAYALSPQWSVGAGVSVNYMEAELTNAVDFAAICAMAVGGVCPNGALPGQGQFDGFVRNEGDDVSFGYNLGILWHMSNTRIGLSYRSEIEHDLEGQADFRQPESLGGFAALGPQLGGALGSTFRDSDITAKVTLPDSMTFSAWHDLGRVALTADITWYDWADIPEVRIERDLPGASPLVESLGWDSTVRTAVGVIFDASRRWTVRAGVAFDESPVPEPELRSPRVPDDDRTWVALGASYRLAKGWSLDVGYARLFVGSSDIDRAGATGGQLTGEFDSSADLVSLQVSARL